MRPRLACLATLAFLTSGVACSAADPPGNGAPPGPGTSVVALPAAVPARVCAAPAPAGAPVPVVQSGLHGHAEAIAYSPDGTSVAIGDQSPTIRVFDPRTGEMRGVLRGHTLRVNGLAWSPKGDTLASTSVDGTARLWDLRTGQPRSMGPLAMSVYSVSWSPGGMQLATQHDTVTRLWGADGKPRFDLGTQLAGHAWSPDGTAIVTWRREYGLPAYIAVWDTATGVARFRVPWVPGDSSAAWSPDGKTLAWMQGETVSLADPVTGTVRSTFVAAGALGSHLAWSPEGKRLAIGETGDGVQLWDPERRTRITTFTGVSHETFAWSPDGTMLAVTAGNAVQIRDAATGAARTLLPGATDRVWPLAWSPDSKAIAGASGVQDPDMLFWDVATGARRAAPKQRYRTRRFAWSPDGKAMVSIGSPGGSDREKVARVWDARTGKLRATLLDTASDRGAMDGHHEVAWSPGGARIALAGMEHVTLWDADRAQKIARLDDDRGYQSEHALAWSPDGKTLATSGGKQVEIRLWNGDTGASIGAAPSGLRHVWSLAWSPDGAMLAAAGSGQIKLFDPRSRVELRVITGSFRGVLAMTFTPDGRKLVAGGEDGKVHVFDPTTTAPLPSFQAHASRIRSLAMTPDGIGLATAGDDRQVWIWDLAGGRQLAGVPEEGNDNLEQVAFSPDGEVLGIVRGSIELYRLRDGAVAFLRPVAVGADVHGLAWTDSGLFGGDPAAFAALRLRDGPDVLRAPLLRAAGVTDRLGRPDVLASFLAGCPTRVP